MGAQDIINHQCEEKPFSCSECDKEFSYEKDMLEHKKTHKEKSFECSTCDRKFKRPNDLRNHEKIHNKLTCADCGEEFEGKHEEKSKNNRPSRCPECDKKLRQKNSSVCDFYRAGHCMFGPKGQNKKGKCYKKHPEPCEKFSDGGCKDSNCQFMHRAPVCTFYLKKKCDRKIKRLKF